MKIEAGDVVRLRSGSPRMTVIAIAHNLKVELMWFIDGECKTTLASPQALKKVGDET